jgi:hypothetical protein
MVNLVETFFDIQFKDSFALPVGSSTIEIIEYLLLDILATLVD